MGKSRFLRGPSPQTQMNRETPKYLWLAPALYKPVHLHGSLQKEYKPFTGSTDYF